MAPRPKYKLKLTGLRFISPVDTPAQETATVRCLKSEGGADRLEVSVRDVKVNDEAGIVFGWAFTCKEDGKAYYDLHGDNIVEQDMVQVAADFMLASRASDRMHDGVKDGTVVFGMPWDSEIAEGMLGIKGADSTTGLMVGVKPSAAVLEEFKSGKLTGFSIEYTGVRAPVDEPKSATTDEITAAVMNALKAAGWSGAREAKTEESMANDKKAAAGAGADQSKSVEDLTQRVAELETRNAELEAEVSAQKAAATDEVVYTADDGTVFRKSDGDKLVAMAKRADAADRRAAHVALCKRAEDELPHLPGDADVRATLLKAIDGIADETMRGEVMKSVKAANNAAAGFFEFTGHTGALDAQGKAAVHGAKAAWNTLVTEYETQHKCTRTVALAKCAELHPDAFAAYQEV